MERFMTGIGKRNKDLGLDRLLSITKGCRPDMHEPDEQNIKARILGDHLDNAFGNTININPSDFQEFVIVIERWDGEKFQIEVFNLASLIALARQAPSGDL